MVLFRIFAPGQIESFCNRQMQPYAPLFPKGSAQAQLDQIDRRFAWFRRLLRGVDLRFDGVFPRHWRLQHRLCMRFLTQTRADLLEVLEGGSKEAEDVTVLLKVCKVTSKRKVYRYSKYIPVPRPCTWPHRNISGLPHQESSLFLQCTPCASSRRPCGTVGQRFFLQLRYCL